MLVRPLWGFTNKSNIEALFRKKRKVWEQLFHDSLTTQSETSKFQATLNYFFEYCTRNHCTQCIIIYSWNSTFSIVTTHFCCGYNFQGSPVPDSTYVSCENWFNNNNTHFFWISLFLKARYFSWDQA